jgi:hypothetical protein
MADSRAANKRDTHNRGRPRLGGERLHVTFRLRRGRSEAEDRLFDRLAQLTRDGQRSRFIRRVLTTGEIEPVLDRELARETERLADALDGLATFWDEEDD